MPVTTGNTFVDALLRPDRAAGRFIFNWQERVLEEPWIVQDMARRTAIARVTREVKDELLDANEIHLDRLRTGFFDKIYEAGARSVDPTFVMTPADTRAVQAESVTHYTKMRNARAFAARDSERFVSHLWEDTKKRRAQFGRRTQYLAHYPFKGRLGTLEAVHDPAGLERMDRRFGVKAAVGSDGRKWGLEKYARLQGDAFANRLHNLGSLNAAERIRMRGRQVAVIVSDGPECGWTYHDDPQKANGMVVSIEEARQNPIAHPHCVRRFSISHKPKDLEKMSERQSRFGRQIAKTAAVAASAGLGAYAASALSNVAIAGAVRLAGSQLFENWMNHLRLLIWQGDPTAQHLFRFAAGFQSRMDDISAEIMEGRLRGENVRLLPFGWKTERAWPGGPEWSTVAEEWRKLRVAGDEFLHHGKQLPDDVLRYLNARFPLGRTDEQIQLAFEGMQRTLRSSEVRANLVSVINAEAQRRNLLYRALLRLPAGEQFASKIRMSWASWGPKLRVDPFDWLRGHVTFTPTGLIRSVSFFPKSALRGVVKMYQDGSIGGHISALPKNFMNGIFRALVEIDEHGALVGNIRIVPGGPLRVTLGFVTKQPKEVAESIAEQFTHFLVLTRGDVVHAMNGNHIADHLVTFMQNHASPLGFRPRDLASAIVRRLRDESLIEGAMVQELQDAIIARGLKLTFDPRDIYLAAQQFGAARVFRDLGYAVRQFKFDRAVVEWRIFNKSIFDISANLRIPINFVRRAVEDLSLQNVLSPNGDGTYTGLFRWVITNPVELFQTVRVTSRQMLEETGTGLKSTLFGHIRFSGLRAVEDNPFLHALKRGSVRFMNRFHFDQDGLREIATNMRIFGWNIYDIANVLKLRAQDVNDVVKEGFARMHLMAFRLGFTKLDDAIPRWDTAVEEVRQMLSFRPDGEPVGRADALFSVTKAMKNKFTNPGEERALRFLAGIKPSDTPAQIKLKLVHLRNWINTVETRKGIIYRDWEGRGPLNPFGFQGLPPGVRREYLQVYHDLAEFADTITLDDLTEKALEIARRTNVVPLRAQAGFNFATAVDRVDYWFGRFQTYFMQKGWALNTIRNTWDRLSVNFDIATRRFLPISFRQLEMPPETQEIIDNWRNYAVFESSTRVNIAGVQISVGDTVREAFEAAGKDIIDFLDDNYVKELLTNAYYLRRRYPNIELPEFRLVSNVNEGIFYYQDGKIHMAFQYGENFEGARNILRDLRRADQVSGAQLQYRRYTDTNDFRRLIFHEYGHYLMDFLEDSEIEDLQKLVKQRFGLELYDTDDRIQEILSIYRTRGLEVSDPLGSPFADWIRLARLRGDLWRLNDQRAFRVVDRQVGRYGTQNLDELVAESMSHYLEFRDPIKMGLDIGSFFDEKILGRHGFEIVRNNRPSFSNFDSDASLVRVIP